MWTPFSEHLLKYYLGLLNLRFHFVYHWVKQGPGYLKDIYIWIAFLNWPKWGFCRISLNTVVEFRYRTWEEFWINLYIKDRCWTTASNILQPIKGLIIGKEKNMYMFLQTKRILRNWVIITSILVWESTSE